MILVWQRQETKGWKKKMEEIGLRKERGREGNVQLSNFLYAAPLMYVKESYKLECYDRVVEMIQLAVKKRE